MVRVGIKQEVGGFVVVVENKEQNYHQEFATYEPKRGPFGVTPQDFESARQQALNDAMDWVVKFLAAGIKAEVVEVMT
jgi:hypothetical protein